MSFPQYLIFPLGKGTYVGGENLRNSAAFFKRNESFLQVTHEVCPFNLTSFDLNLIVMYMYILNEVTRYD